MLSFALLMVGFSKELYLNRVVGQFGFLYGISVHSELSRHSILFSSQYKIKTKAVSKSHFL